MHASKVLCRAAVATPPTVVGVLTLDHLWLSERGSFQDRSIPSRPGEGKRCLIVGGGVVAVSSAYFLRCQGFNVTILEAHGDVGSGTSNVNAGTIRLSSYNSLVSMANIKKCVKKTLMPGELGSIYRFDVSNIVLDLYYWRWCFRVFLNALNTNLEERTSSFIRSASPQCLKTVESVASSASILPHDYSASLGSLSIQCTEEALAAAQSRYRRFKSQGIPTQIFTKAETAEEEPHLQPAISTDLIFGSQKTPDDWSGNCGAFTHQLAHFCRNASDDVVEFVSGACVQNMEYRDESIGGGAPTITAVITADGRRFEGFDHIVIAAGCGSAQLLRQVGIYLPIYPCKGYAMELKASDLGKQLSTSSLTFEPLDLFVTQFASGRPGGSLIRFTSGAEFAGWDERSVSPSCVRALRNRAQVVFPDVPAETWDLAEIRVGGRPWCVDDLPIVGGTRFTNLWLNTGHGHTGWRFACATGESLAAAMTGSKWPGCMDPVKLSLSRFESLWRAEHS